MKRVTLALVLMIFLTSTAALTIKEPDISVNPSKDEIQNYTEIYNNKTDEIPGLVKTLVGDQNINVHYENNTYGVKMNNMKAENVTEPFNESSLEIWVEKEDILEVMNSTEPREEIESKLKNGDIRYEEHGTANRIRFGLARTAQKLGLL